MGLELERETYARQLRLITPTIRPVGCLSNVRLVVVVAFFSLTRISSSSSCSSPESSASSFLRVAESQKPCSRMSRNKEIDGISHSPGQRLHPRGPSTPSQEIFLQ
jgi:hypothetical protein